MKFTVHTADSAPAGSRATLAQISERYGFVPNLAGAFAESPAALGALLGALAAYDGPAFVLSDLERQVVMLSVSVANRCSYCAAAHGMLAHKSGLDRDQVASLQQGGPLDDPRLEALRVFVTAVVVDRGRVDAAVLDAFGDAGFAQAQVIEVVYGVALKTLTNYANHLTDVPVNAPFGAYLPDWSGAPAEARTLAGVAV